VFHKTSWKRSPGATTIPELQQDCGFSILQGSRWVKYLLVGPWRLLFFPVLILLIALPGCQSENRADVDVDPVAKITMYDRLRLTLADADAAGIHLFDLKKMRKDIETLKATEPELAELLRGDLDRIEALPKNEVKAKVAIGKEMYARFKKRVEVE
jgi:hypothetical protein